MTDKAKNYIMLHASILIYALSSICSKIASGFKITSINFWISYAAVLFFLAVYALVWQQIIKSFPISVAYANKAVVVIWGILFGYLLFNESISIQKMVGAGVIIIGILFLNKKEKN